MKRAVAAPPQEAGPLTLERALDLADRLHPDLAQARARVEAAEGRALQAGLFPNPALVGRMESAPLEGRTAGDAEYVAGLSQRLPLGGRLGAGRETERLEAQRLARELDVRRLEVRSRIHGAFATALFSAEAARLQTENVELTRRALAVTRARRDGGDATADEVARAEMEEVRARLETDKAEGLRALAFVALAAALGEAELRIGRLEGTLETALELPTLESVLVSLDGGAYASLAQADVDVARARVELARSERVPDVTLDLFYRRLGASDRNAFDVGLVVPLPLFDRSQGRIQEAEAQRRGAEARAKATRDDAVRRVREAHGRFSQALGRVRLVRDELLPRATTVLKTAESRYGAGDMSLSEVILLRRETLSVRLAYLDGLREVMEGWGELRPFLRR